MRKAATIVSILSALLWAAYTWDVFTGYAPGMEGAELRAAAVASIVIAAMLWCTLALVRRLLGDLAAVRDLASTVAQLTRPGGSRRGESPRLVR